MGDFLLWSTIFVLGNMFDIITTYWGSEGLTADEIRSRELNPFARGYIHKRWLAILSKMVVTCGVVVLVYVGILTGSWDCVKALRVLSLLLVFVVCNNVYTNWAWGHGRLSVGSFLTKRLRFPCWLAFVVLVGFMGVMSYVLDNCLLCYYGG